MKAIALLSDIYHRIRNQCPKVSMHSSPGVHICLALGECFSKVCALFYPFVMTAVIMQCLKLGGYPALGAHIFVLSVTLS